METMKCEVCGRDLPITKFSKSYKNRCRECVAERTRLCRHLSKEQKAEREIKQIDWEQRRFELVKAALPIAMTWVSEYTTRENTALKAIAYADAVIAKLREE